jgi:large subunit ribosomal protein L38
MDKFRDPKQVNKEYLIKKLAKTHPFEGAEPKLQFPNAHPIDKKVQNKYKLIN